MTPFVRKRIKKLLHGSKANQDFLLRWAKKDKEVLMYVMQLRGINPKNIKGDREDELLVAEKK